MTAADVLDILAVLDEARVAAWLDGGWAVDAMLETQSRTHDDLDLIVELAAVSRLQSALARKGYAIARGEPPKSFELVDDVGRQVDVHPVAFDGAGDGRHRMEDDQDWVYPASGFTGRGRILDRVVRCLTPAVQMLCHSGYPPHLGSYDDVWALSRRFGIPVPGDYSGDRNSYARRVS